VNGSRPQLAGLVGRAEGGRHDQPMTEDVWTRVDEYWAGKLLAPDPGLEAAAAAADAAGIPPIAVSALQGALLELLARSIGARRILEVGTLAGYSTIRLARALPTDGELVTCEIDPRHADVARANLATAGLDGLVDVRVGPAVATLATLTGPFDLVFIDADKASNAAYLRAALELSRPGTMIIVDNVVRGGAVVDADSTDRSVVGTRALADALAAEPRLDATAVQTVGEKGYDGFVLALVR
jgi:predicted O-methyltransferase YrrM